MRDGVSGVFEDEQVYPVIVLVTTVALFHCFLGFTTLAHRYYIALGALGLVGFFASCCWGGVDS
ncbi:hypothetical protein F5Y09DRAFT_175264 [Xylaria sp. FL1042]|nr:hypothetical protein F5Y09DRAFT_175264 [Xylaria sp. FL1042]